MRAFDSAWHIAKMGRIFRGGRDPEGAYWTHLPMMANSFALGGQQQGWRSPTGSLFEIDDPSINEAAIQELFRQFRTEQGGYLSDLDVGRNTFDNVKTPKFEDIPSETFHPDEVDALESEFWHAQNKFEEPQDLSPETLDWLRTGNVGAFYHTPDTSSYKTQLDFLLGGFRGGQEKPQMPPLSEAGVSGRQPLIDRLAQTGMFENQEEIPTILQRYISGLQGVGESWRNTPEQNEALKRGFQEAGIDWLAYIDKDPRGWPTLMSLNDRMEQFEPKTVANYEERAKEAGIDPNDIFQCEECGEMKTDRNAYSHRRDLCGNCEGAVYCAGCHEEWDDCRCDEEECFGCGEYERDCTCEEDGDDY